MTITKLGYQWYSIKEYDEYGTPYKRIYMYYTKREAIKLFREYFNKLNK